MVKRMAWCEKMVFILVALVTTADVWSMDGVGSSSLAAMPIREVTIFKDGHSFVLHAGDVPTNEQGDITLDYLPTPVIGTFWPYEEDPRVELKGVSAGKQRVELEKTALSIRDLLAANAGAEILVREKEGTYRATIVGLPLATAEELEATEPAGSGPRVSQPGSLILLKSDDGTRAVPVDRLQDVTFIDSPSLQLKYEEIRNVLKLQLDWGGKPPGKTARVGMTYLQKGLRWIPSYSIKLQDDGMVHIMLQATILNELVDLEGVTANLLIGVPNFDFKTTIDSIALKETMAQLSPYFQHDSHAAHAFSNSIMVQTQSTRTSEYRNDSSSPAELAPAPPDAGQNEDLFVFTVRDITLAYGERLVIPVGQWTLPYEDVFRVELPIAPPLEVRQGFGSSQEAELAKMFLAPKVKHLIRITNNQSVPLTTAPALITSGEGVLGQGLMTYTAPGASVDLQVTTAINVPLTVEDEESKRTPQAMQWRNQSFTRIDMRGLVKLTNYRSDEIKLEVVRSVMGAVDSAEASSTVRRLGVWSQEPVCDRPEWWAWYAWPNWWMQVNSVSRIQWRQSLASGETLELPYTWYYYWAESV